MTRCIPLLAMAFMSLGASAQQPGSKKINVGIEQDVLPYVTGGYFAGIWAGKDHVRVRAITAKVNKPDFIIQNGFTNNKVTAYALLCDYFLQKNWKGWWLGTGLVYWKSSIQADEKINTADYKNWLVNGSIGYNFRLCRNFYVSPWGALHIRVGGDRQVTPGNKTFTPPLINPEASVKFGVWF